MCVKTESKKFWDWILLNEMFHIENTRWPFLWADMWGRPPPCHSRSPASSWERVRRGSCIQLWRPRCSHSFMPRQKPVHMVPRSCLCWLFLYTVCGLEMNVKTYCGHLLSVPVWLILPKSYTDLGRRWGTGLFVEPRWKLQRYTVCSCGHWWSGKRLSTFSEAIMSKGVHPMWSWQTGKTQARKRGLKQTALSRVPW